MKILHLIPTLEGGGAERQLALLAIEQARRGMEVHVASRRFGVHKSSLCQNGVTLHSLGDWRSLNPLLFFCIKALLHRLRPTIVQTWLTQMDIVGGAAALMFGVPWIGTERSNALFYRNRHMVLESFLRELLFKRATAIVTNSALAATQWQRKLPHNVTVFAVSNAIDVPEILRNAARPMLVDPCIPPLILVVGRLIPSKGLDVVIQALKKLSLSQSFIARIIGDGPLRNHINQSIQYLDLSNRISVLPYSTAWWAHMSEASMLISMSRVEGQPNVVLESMAAACPLIVSDIPSHREILDESSTIFVPQDDVEKLVIAVKSVIASPEESRVRASQARLRAEAFTVINMTNTYDTIYRNAVKKVT